jgi:hypothetical protein
MMQSTEEQETPSTVPNGPANRSLEELEYNWTRLRWRVDGAMEEGRLPRDPHHKREINRGNFTLSDTNDFAAGPVREVTNGVLSRPVK